VETPKIVYKLRARLSALALRTSEKKRALALQKLKKDGFGYTLENGVSVVLYRLNDKRMRLVHRAFLLAIQEDPWLRAHAKTEEKHVLKASIDGETVYYVLPHQYFKDWPIPLVMTHMEKLAIVAQATVYRGRGHLFYRREHEILLDALIKNIKPSIAFLMGSKSQEEKK
jgi:hypothetical protein